MSSSNPYAAPDLPSDFERQVREEYGGLRRLPYFLISFGVGIVNNLIQFFALQQGVAILALICTLVGLVATVVLGVQRLKNLGYSGLWVLGLIVPLLNILVALRCLAAPEGYADHKTLDTPGKVIVGLILGLFVILIAFVVLAAPR
jgi:uncharacterized membrane protein YhaH (DUF805 family)